MIDSGGHVFCIVVEVVTEDEAQSAGVVFDGNNTLKTCIISSRVCSTCTSTASMLRGKGPWLHNSHKT